MAPRALGALLAVVAAIAFVVSIVSSAWWAGHPTVDGHRVDTQHIAVGLLHATDCDRGSCAAVPIERTGELTRFVELGAIGLAVLLALALAISAWSVGDRRNGVAIANVVTTLLAAAGGGALIALGPQLAGKQSVSVPIGWGAFVFAGAVASSLIASTLARKIQPEPLRLKSGGPLPVPLPEVVVSPMPALLGGGTVPGLPPPTRASTPEVARASTPDVARASTPDIARAAVPELVGPPIDPFARTALPEDPRPKPPSAPPPVRKTKPSAPPPIAVTPVKRTSDPMLRPSAPTLAHAVPPMPAPDNMPPPSKLSAKDLAAAVAVDAGAPEEPHFESTARGTLDPRIAARAQRSASEARTGQHEATVGDVTSTGVSITNRIITGDARALSTLQREVARAPTEDPFESGRADALVPEDGPLTDEISAVSGVTSDLALDTPSEVTAGPVTDVLSVPAAAEVLEDLGAQASGTIGDVTDATRAVLVSRETELTPIPTIDESLSTALSTLPPPKNPMSETVQAGPTPACPQCESPMAWVEEHLRFYCKQCRMYF